MDFPTLVIVVAILYPGQDKPDIEYWPGLNTAVQAEGFHVVALERPYITMDACEAAHSFEEIWVTDYLSALHPEADVRIDVSQCTADE